MDQRLTLYADGLVELDERHRTRDKTELMLGSQELDRIRTALEQVPDSSWSRRSTITGAMRWRGIRRFFTPWAEMDLGSSFFELRRGRLRICGETGCETEAEEARMLLDGLRVHAVRLAEERHPTGAH